MTHDDDEPQFEIPAWWPPEFTVQRLSLWAQVNWLLPIHLAPGDSGSEPDYLAMRPQCLPRVPAVGEGHELPDHYRVVESVRWASDGRVTVRIRAAHVSLDYLDKLRAAGWAVFPRHDADDWARDLAD